MAKKVKCPKCSNESFDIFYAPTGKEYICRKCRWTSLDPPLNKKGDENV